MTKIIVAIDGHSSCGKSTIAKQLARYAGYKYVDTGAMYRATALAALRADILTDNAVDEARLRELVTHTDIGFVVTPEGQHTTLDDRDVERDIRTIAVGNAASRVSTIGFVRRRMVELQQAMGRERGIVMDGRDIGTVVFPDAELKIFVTARADVRARRRYLELAEKGQPADYDAVFADVLDRDYRDTHRAESPLVKAADALLLDNSDLTLEQQQRLVEQWFDNQEKKY